MQVAGLLSHEQLSTIFLNVEELAEVNKQFTENLRDAIEIALDEGDEDLCTVKIGRIFKDAEPMLGAFKSYCTRQVSLKSLKCCPRFYRRSKVLTNFFFVFSPQDVQHYLFVFFLGSRAVKNFPPRHVSSHSFLCKRRKTYRKQRTFSCKNNTFFLLTLSYLNTSQWAKITLNCTIVQSLTFLLYFRAHLQLS